MTTQEKLRNIIRDLQHASHELAWHRDEESQHIKEAKIMLTQIRVAMIELLDEEY